MKKGTIYERGSRFIGEVRVGRLVFWLKLVARTLAVVGSCLMLVACVGLVFVYIPLMKAEVRYYWGLSAPAKAIAQIRTNGKKSSAGVKTGVVETKKTLETRPTWDVPDWGYSVYIAKIGAVSRIIPNVDAGSYKDYSLALKQGVAEAKGLAHPGEVGTTFLFAHSVGTSVDFARYNAVFYLLDKLNQGDVIEVVFKNKLYKYRVYEKEILNARDVKHLVPQMLEEKLVLSTCYPPGTTWKRLVVVAVPIR